uniref:K Homology domain-containing protein n=1 Tax=Mucochytrium quahogii TaxID=96639 RepID=A0A7S2RFF5_9STRA|mmetsp:Transcript_20381/g.33616  ORF Transcript_20381/g.33616 Transcript_20381/m.33616 type:complete len:429 (+) Transcript_20381:210-1496(+)
MEYEQEVLPAPLSIVVDAANVAWGFAKSQPGWTDVPIKNKTRPPMLGLTLCFEFWKQYGVTPVAICPRWWFEKGNRTYTDDEATMQELRDAGMLFGSPSGEHDDVYIVDYAYRTDGYMVSNDKYRDHIKTRNLCENWATERRIGFMFIRNLFIPNPDDIKRLEEFCETHHKFVGGDALATSLLPPPPQNTVGPAVSEFKTEIRVPARVVGMIIGKQGSNLAKISNQTSTRIDIVDDGMESVVCIIGKSQDNVDQAARLVHQVYEPDGGSMDMSDGEDMEGQSQDSCFKEAPLSIAPGDPVSDIPVRKMYLQNAGELTHSRRAGYSEKSSFASIVQGQGGNSVEEPPLNIAKPDPLGGHTLTQGSGNPKQVSMMGLTPKRTNMAPAKLAGPDPVGWTPAQTVPSISYRMTRADEKKKTLREKESDELSL